MHDSLQEGKIEAEGFTHQLYKELKSTPQPCLVPFLKVTTLSHTTFIVLAFMIKILDKCKIIPPPHTHTHLRAGITCLNGGNSLFQMKSFELHDNNLIPEVFKFFVCISANFLLVTKIKKKCLFERI